MIRSMTAFGTSEIEIDGYIYTWEVRSVNHRYLDINFRIPESLRMQEADFRALISKQMKRGKVDCSLNCQRQADSQARIRIDTQRLKALILAMADVQSEIKNLVPTSSLELMKWPGILIEEKLDIEKLESSISDLLQKAVSRNVECREREGAQLKGMIVDRCQSLGKQVQLVRERLPEIAEKLKCRLKSKLETLPTEVDPVRFEQEIVFMLQKMDVDEEMERLETHIVEVKRVLGHEDIAGRRLDFLLQEMNREANTLGSKSLDNETTQACVEMKVLIEQMREQVQNIE